MQKSARAYSREEWLMTIAESDFDVAVEEEISYFDKRKAPSV
jgi:hypothetical protein